MQLKFPHLPVLATPYLIFALGVVLNIIAISANSGYMPVAQSAILGGYVPAGTVIDEVHRVMQNSDHLKVLCDWIQVPRQCVASPGDLCLWAGEWLMGPSFVAWLTMIWRDVNQEAEKVRGRL